MPTQTHSISTERIHKMVLHWLSTPVEGYLGSSYGADIKSLIAQAMATANVDKIITKMKHDIPVLSMIPKGQLNIYLQNIGIGLDKKRLVISISGHHIMVGSEGEIL